tara:strand:- start:13 stop:474 length:462 start_codon:yes stop_codon:yes gene_type:complete
MYTKKNTRVTFRSNRRSNFKRSNNFSNGKHRNKGNITQQYNKYLKLAKEASSSGDRIQSEYYYQFTDHYYRLMLDLGITPEDNDPQETKLEDLEASTSQKNNDNNSESLEKKDQEEKINLNSNEDEEVSSIESIPFISEPPKKKTSKNKKASV